AGASRLVGSMSDEVEEVDVEGHPALQLAGDTAASAASSGPSVLLAPSFEVYVVGSHPRDRLIPPRWVERAWSHRASLKWARSGRPQLAGPIPALLLDGVVSGMWDRRGSGKRVEVRVEPFGRLSAAQRGELEAEVARIGGFLEAGVTLTVGPLR